MDNKKIEPFLGTPITNTKWQCASSGPELGSLFWGNFLNYMAHWVLTHKKFRPVIEYNPDTKENKNRTWVTFEYID